MDILKLLTYEEKIGGLAVFDSRVEAIVLEFDSQKGILSIKGQIAVDLPNGVIEAGSLKDEKAFGVALGELIAKIRPIKISSFVVSLPSNFVYSHNFSFPAALSEAQADEAMKLNLKFSLPIEEELLYLDWEPVESREAIKKEVLFCAGGKEAIDKYLNSFAKSGMAPVAVEFHGLSASRVVGVGVDGPMLVGIFSDRNMELSILDGGVLKFLQSYNLTQIKEAEGLGDSEAVLDKAWRIINFYNSEKEGAVVKKICLMGEYKVIDEYKKILSDNMSGIEIGICSAPEVFPKISIAESSNLPFVAFGSALRGLMPRGEDSIISLMAMGTEKAYQQKRFVSFIKLASDFISVLSVFFVVLYFGSWMLMSVLMGNIDKSLSQQGGLPEGLIELKGQAVKFNQSVKQMSEIDDQIPKWSRFIEKINTIGTSGITLNRIDATSLETVNISGVALNRDNLLQFKIVLENSGLFFDVKIPINYLEQKDNISFSLNLKLKDSSFILQ